MADSDIDFSEALISLPLGNNGMSNRLFQLVVASAFLAGGWAFGDVIDFENAADYGGDGAAISNDYLSQYGLQMTTWAGADKASAGLRDATFEQVGLADGGDAFNYTDSNGNLVYGGGNGGDLGDYYLAMGTTSNMDELYNTGYVKMQFDYDSAVTGVSGEIWDLDENSYGTEQFTVTAYDANGAVVSGLTSPEVSYDDDLDGLPWSWSLAGDDITQVVMEFVGTRTNYLGLAFDNFDYNSANASATATSHAAPVPGAFPLGLLGLAFVAHRRKRKGKKATAAE